MSYSPPSDDAVRIRLSIRPDDSDLQRIVDEAVKARTADLEKELEKVKREAAASGRAGGPGGGPAKGSRGRRTRREPPPNTEYAGPPPEWPPHGTLPRPEDAPRPRRRSAGDPFRKTEDRQGFAWGRDWTTGTGENWDDTRQGRREEGSRSENPDPGQAEWDESEGRWVYPDDPTIGFKPSYKGMGAEPAKAYLEPVERRYQPAVSRPPFESPWLSRTHRPYLPGEQSMISPRGFQQEKVNRRGGRRWSQSLQADRIRDLQREFGMSWEEALAQVQEEAGGRAEGGLYSGVGPTAGITPRSLSERIRELERANKEEARTAERRKAAAMSAAHRLAGGLGNFQGPGGGAVLFDVLQEAGGGAFGAAASARAAARAGESLGGIGSAAKAGASLGAEAGFQQALIQAIGSTGPVGKAIAAAAVAGPLGKALFDAMLRFMSQKGFEANRDWQFIIEEQVQALLTQDELKSRMLGIDSYVITSTDRYVPGSGATTYNSLESRDEIITSNIGLAERAVGVSYGGD